MAPEQWRVASEENQDEDGPVAGQDVPFLATRHSKLKLVQFRARFSTTAAPHGFMSVRSRVALRARPRKSSLRVPSSVWQSQDDSGLSWNHFKGNC